MRFVSHGLCVLVFALVGASAQTSPVPPGEAVPFEAFITERFSKTDSTWTFEMFCPTRTNIVAARVLQEYGSMFAASDSVLLPKTCIYQGDGEVKRFQNSVTMQEIDIEGVRVRLQKEAADALLRAVTEAREQHLRISPFDGAIAGSRTYGDSLMLWNGRFFSGLDYWTKRGRLTQADRDEIGKLDLQRRIEKVMEWESQGIWFSTDKTRSIFMSIAAPGTSQHLAMIAFDVAEYADPSIRLLLNKHGWFQTVVGDPLHFTYLGLPESALPQRGLRAVMKGGFMYWVPNLSSATH